MCVSRTLAKLCFVKAHCLFTSLQWGLLALLLTSVSLPTSAKEVILRHSFAGNMSFELTGNTLRRSNNTCSMVANGQSSGSINLPTNSSIKAAYLYWSGSGAVDSSATLNGTTVNAEVSYIETYQGLDYYSSKAEVTNLISTTASATYTVSGVDFDGSSSYCNTSIAYGGWALTVVYENTNQPLRVINIFDGFKNFWGNQLVLIPNNFVIAQNSAALGGKHAHITWEGDAGNSQSRNGFNERLTFEGSNLTDANNPQGNQFNGYSNVTGATSGVDIDEYPIGSLLTPGKTSVQTTYSTGQDSVFLTAEIISVPNEPVAELSIQQLGPSRFVRDANNTVNFSVKNNGPNTAPQNTQVSIPLGNGLSFDSFLGNQWNCSATNSAVNCVYNASITQNTSASNLAVTLFANTSTTNSINLTSSVTGVLFDNILSNNTRAQSYNVISASLANSTKTVTDINGGNVQPGDILRYQIDIKESNGIAVSGISLVDHLPENISAFNVVSLPSGANVNSLAAPSGDNASGLVSVSNISIAANATSFQRVAIASLTYPMANTALKLITLLLINSRQKPAMSLSRHCPMHRSN